jgi:hypothetical protein
MEIIWAAVGAAVLILALVVQRKTGVAEKSTTFMAGLADVSSSTPGWLAFLKLFWIWSANAVGSLVLWVFAVPGSGGSAAFYNLGWFFLIGNIIGVLVTAVFFATGRRSGAVQSAKWVVPVILGVLFGYAVLESIVT